MHCARSIVAISRHQRLCHRLFLRIPPPSIIATANLHPTSPRQEFSTTPAASEQKQIDKDFKSEKVKDLFERITASCSADDARQIGAIINDMFGRPMRKNEFYYRNIGGVKARKGKGGSGGEAGAEEATSEPAKTTVDLKLTGFDAKSKIKVIKECRAIAGLGLKEAKELVEGAPAILMKDIKPEDGDDLKAKLETIGATVELV